MSEQDFEEDMDMFDPEEDLSEDEDWDD